MRSGTPFRFRLPMTVAQRRVASAVVSAALLTFVAVGPALADGELGHTGRVGQHSLRDSPLKSGATCAYKRVVPSPGGYHYEGRLKELTVRPPRVRAIAGTQTVGWRFIVQLAAIQSNHSAGPWQSTYDSSIQTAVTDSTHNARLTAKSIGGVKVPTSSVDDGPPWYVYRVLVKMFWYWPDGRVQGTATHEVQYYRWVYGGGWTEPNEECNAWVIWP